MTLSFRSVLDELEQTYNSLYLFPHNTLPKIQTNMNNFSTHFALHIRKSYSSRYIILTDIELLHRLRALHPIIYLDTDESGSALIYNENTDFCCHAVDILERVILTTNITNLKEYYRHNRSDCPVFFRNELSKNHISRCVVITVNTDGSYFYRSISESS